MDNMKPLLDAVTDDSDVKESTSKGDINKATATGDINKATATGDINKATATGGANEAKVTGDKTGRQKCHDATKGVQRESSCCRRGPDGPPWRASMGWSYGPTIQQPFGHPCGPPIRHPFGPQGGHQFGPSGGHQFGPSGGHPFVPSRGHQFGPPGGHPFGPSGGHQFGPSGGHPFGPPGGHPFGPSGGHPFGPSGGHPFGPSGGPSEWMWGRGPPFMNGPSEYSCPSDRGMPHMNDFSHWGNITGPSSMHGPPTFGPMMCPCDTNLPCEDETVDDESDEWDAGKESAEDAGKESAGDAGKESTGDAGKDSAGDAGKESAGGAGKENADNTGKDGPALPKQKDGARAVKCERPRRVCPWSDGMRRRGMRCSSRHANTSCRRDDPFSMYCRYRRGPWAQSRYAHWAAFSGDCCQQAASTGWGECPYPSPFFAPFACNWSGESNTDPDTDNQKQDGDQPTPEECCQFFKGAPVWFRRHGGCCSGRRWQGGPSRNKIYKMLTRKRNMVKEKLQRIESMLENMQPNEEGATETTVGGDASPQPAASQTETDPGQTMPRMTNTDREWEMIADSE